MLKTSMNHTSSADASTSNIAPLPRGIVYFDGVCGLCNGVVNLLMKLDHRQHLVYAPLQGETARQRLSPEEIENLNSLVFSSQGRTYHESAAAIRILWQLGPGWRLLGVIFWLIPKPLRDLCYRLIATYRYRFFGKHESCRMPTPEERKRFLP